MPSSNEERSLLLLSLYIAFHKVVLKLKGTSIILININIIKLTFRKIEWRSIVRKHFIKKFVSDDDFK